MGFAIAEFLATQGASVTLITGPTSVQTQHPAISVQKVTSSDQMYTACMEKFPNTDIAVLAAAVADYKPSVVAEQKIKKKDASLSIDLVKTHDIAASLGEIKKAGQFIVGFALETEHEHTNAVKKLESKNFDLIVLNSLNDNGAGFGYDTNKITLIDKNQTVKSFELKTKKEVARDIVHAIIERVNA
jgi:phosphopantothenoylcysteine decarboxylase/phosphopantothenate--cysteine ligase